MMISVNKLREVLSYDPESGVLTWVTRPSNRVKIGDRAGLLGANGYFYVGLGGKRLLAHRIAFALSFGEWPSDRIDHIDGNPMNNTLANLRPCSQSQNLMNARLSSRNTSGVRGVCWSAARGKWYAQIKKDQRSYHLGYFDTKAEAAAARAAASEKLFGEFARAA